MQRLGSESERWEEQRKQFQVQMSTLIGDMLLCSAFIAYIGYFDQHYRRALLQQWQSRLEQAGVKYKEDLNVVEYLSTPDQRLR